MSESERYTFIAVISIVLPGHENVTEIEVVLAPADDVTLDDGSVKLLQDCTLAELGHFAGQMEMELWANYQDVPLIELASNAETEIRISFPEDYQDGNAEFALWMEHLAIIDGRILSEDHILSEGQILSEEQIITKGRIITGEDGPDLEPPISPEKVLEKPLEAPAEEEESGEELLEEDDFDVIRAEDEDLKLVEEPPELETLEAALQEIDVDVAEPELVHEERVVDQDVQPLPDVFEPTEIRILGRRRPLNHKTWTAVDILINEEAFRDAQDHAMSSLDREVAGVLVGPMPEKQPDGRYIVHIIDTIIAKHTKMHGASVTYTPESWRYVSDRIAELYPEDSAVIVGWYHTHPGFGIFLSSMDRFIHQNFFIQKWHVALVLDPIASRSGFFCWDRKQELVDTYEFPWPHWAAKSW